MTAATLNSEDHVEGIVGLHTYDLTFAASGDTYTQTKKVRSYTWGVKTATNNLTTNEYQLNESSGVFTLTVAGTATAVRVNLWLLEQK